VQGQGRPGGDLGLQRGDVDAGSHHEQGLRRLYPGVEICDHLLQFRHRTDGVQGAADHPDDRTVVAAHHGQRRGVAFQEEQSGALELGGLADRLGQRAGGVQFGDENDVLDPLGLERLTQSRRRGVISPGHSGGDQMVTALSGAFAGAQNGGDHLLGGIGGCRADTAGNVERILVQGRAVGVFALYQRHADRRGCH
jgi:hypothetical protein